MIFKQKICRIKPKKEFRTKQQAIYKHQNSENNIRGLIKNTKDKIKNLFGTDDELNKVCKAFYSIYYYL